MVNKQTFLCNWWMKEFQRTDDRTIDIPQNYQMVFDYGMSEYELQRKMNGAWVHWAWYSESDVITLICEMSVQPMWMEYTQLPLFEVN